jgi:hippurate hydrolase
MSIREDADAIGGELSELRHALHQEPELGLALPRTQERVLAALDGLGLEISTGTALTSVTAVLRGARPGPTVLLRGDMDALPVDERSGSDFASRIPGVAHVCGHDLHTAALTGVARLLAARRDELAGDVVLMFQPAEEELGGAVRMIDEGVLDASGSMPVAAYAIHVTSGLLPVGFFATRAGTLMSACADFHVTVRGRGGHGASPVRASDPVPAACEMVTALQAAVTRKFDVFDPVVVTVGSFHAGTRGNVIPDTARFDATLRAFSPAAMERLKPVVRAVVEGVAAAHGLAVETSFENESPAVVNDAAAVDRVGSAVGELFGPDRLFPMPDPITTSEDFSRVLGHVPGAMVFVGATPPDRDPATAPFNHAPEAAFDDAALPYAAALLAGLALSHLS